MSAAAPPLLEVRNLRVEFNTRRGTLVAVDDVTGEVTVRSRAVARVLRALPLPWHALRIIALPGVRFISDRIYDLVAAPRHRISSWVGLGRCGAPAPSDRKGGCERTESR